jgi:aminoglycoside phosphotransferase (APT) family kinase protein
MHANLLDNRDEPRIVAELAGRLFSHIEAIERVAEGKSTRVYCIRRAQDNFYLRILPEAGASFAPEALAHTLLREHGALVPEIIYLEHCNESLQRSVMVTTAIAGQSLAHISRGQDIRKIVQAAGRDLALINSIPVAGFGWIKRDGSDASMLCAEHPTYREFAFEYIEGDLALLRRYGLSQQELAAVHSALSHYDAWLDVPQAWLAHGDFDVTHIYHQNGRYTGVIDFGEIRGADPFYDLAHFRLHDGETLPMSLLSWLLEGYREITSLSSHISQILAFTSLLIAIRTLTRFLNRRPDDPYHHIGWQAVRRELWTLHGFQ